MSRSEQQSLIVKARMWFAVAGATERLISREAPMSDEFVIHNWELESLIYERSTLIDRATALTPEEKQLFRMRGERIEQLLNSMVGRCSANRQQPFPAHSASWGYLN
jgi:hypothetical protein